MSGAGNRYRLVITPTAKRQLSERLPEGPAFAAYECIVGPLLENPHRAGKRLRAPLDELYCARRGTYRLIYLIDGERQIVSVIDVAHRRGVNSLHS